MQAIKFFKNATSPRQVVPFRLLNDANSVQSLTSTKLKALSEACKNSDEVAGRLSNVLEKLIDERMRLEDKLQSDYRDFTQDFRFKPAAIASAAYAAKQLLLDPLLNSFSSDECAPSTSFFWNTLSVLGVSGASLYVSKSLYENERHQLNDRIRELDSEIYNIENALKQSSNSKLLPTLPHEGESMSTDMMRP